MVPVLETGVAGLDEILGGGIPVRSMMLILGVPGAGKTVLAEQIAVHQARQGKNVVIFTALSESHEQLLASLREFTFYDETLIGDRIRFLSIQTMLRDGLEATADAIVEVVREQDAAVVVLDGFRGVAGFANTENEVRLFLYQVRTRLALLDATTLVTAEADSDMESDADALTVADGIIAIHNTLWGVRHRRQIEVRKLRAIRHLDGLHALTITADGVTCYPRQEAVYRTMEYVVGMDRASTGLPELDRMLHGGLNRGTATFLSGGPGTGKTLTALHYIMAGVAAGEPGLFIGLSESAEQLYLKAANFGLDLRGAVARGAVALLCLAPVELEVDIVAARLREHVERLGIRRLVIDSIMPIEQTILEPDRGMGFFSSLLNYLRAHDVTGVMTQEGNAFDGHRGDSLAAALADNLIVFRWVEYRERFYRLLSVRKMRQSGFDASVREFRIEEGGIRVLPIAESGPEMMRGIAAWDRDEARATRQGGGE